MARERGAKRILMVKVGEEEPAGGDLAVGLHRAIDCVEHVGPGSEDTRPADRDIESIGGSRVTLTAPLDTGFAGYVLVDRTTYDRLGTAELPREQFGS